MKNPSDQRLRRRSPGVGVNMRLASVFAAFLVLTFVLSGDGQSLPAKIRGYKVHDAKISINYSGKLASQPVSADAAIKLDEPEIVDVGLHGATFEIGARITATGQTGRVDFLTFHDFTINGVAVEIEEYGHSFTLPKGKEVKLPEPVRLTIRVAGITKAAYKQLFTNSGDLPVTGTIFAFGKFRKMGILFKRVIPIKVDLKIQYPLHS